MIGESVIYSACGLEKETNTPAKTAEITWECFCGGLDVIDAVAEGWRELCINGGCNVPFFRPEYFRTYVRCFEGGQRYVIAAAWREKMLVGVLPLVLASERWYGVPVRVLTSPRGDHYMRFDVVCRKDMDRQQVCASLLMALSEVESWDILRLANVCDDGAAAALPEAARACGWAGHGIGARSVPHVSLAGWHGDWDWFIAQRSRNFRHAMRAAKRKADASGELTLRRFDTADARALTTFYQLEAAGWKGRRGTAILRQPHLRQYYDETAECAARNGYFCLYILEMGGQPIAGVYGFTLDGCYFMSKIGCNEEFSQFSPGHLIMNEVLRDCASREVHDVDFLSSRVPWTASWTSQGRTCSYYYVFRNTMPARLMAWFHFKLRPVVRPLYHYLPFTKVES